tara:strand:+ start:10885 stop:12429 length:1545 start_codon:yes stop_codon:yes gene_type:complete
MITVIYCTRESNKAHTEHLRKTSGMANKIEIIEVINNGESLTVAYNRALKEATNDIVVFCHDDIIMNSSSWGRKLIKHFESTDYGILGLAGTTDLSETGRWWDDKSKMVGIVKHSHKGNTWESKYSSNFGKDIIETITVDGLFLAIHKDRVKETFDESVEGFHFYEVDFCFRNHLAGTKIGVMFDVKVTHKSIGQTNEEWEANRVIFAEKFKDNLPVNLEVIPKVSVKDLNIQKPPKVTVIIPTKSNLSLLFNCVDSILEDEYSNLEVLIADTGSNPSEIDDIKEYCKGKPIRLIEFDYYNFSRINNEVVTDHVSDDTELLLFCNNDIKMLNNAITQMVAEYLKKGKQVGTIGARLHYGDNTIQHSGIVMFLSTEGRINLSHKGLRSYYSYHTTNTKVLGNTAAFMLTPKDLFVSIGGFNENYEECFEDVEYNLECLNKNKSNLFVPDAVCYHYESQTRNDDPDKQHREALDLNHRLIPKILATEKSWEYFENISKPKFVTLLANSRKEKVNVT